MVKLRAFYTQPITDANPVSVVSLIYPLLLLLNLMKTCILWLRILSFSFLSPIVT